MRTDEYLPSTPIDPVNRLSFICRANIYPKFIRRKFGQIA
jgi:hypothetical protein